MQHIDPHPAGTIPTGVDTSWIGDNAEEIAKVALESLGAKWDKQDAKNKRAWIANVRCFGNAVLSLGAAKTAEARAAKGQTGGGTAKA